MDQHSTIFDAAFEAENPPRRRDILPKWLRIYTLCVIGLGIIFFIWTALMAPASPPDDSLAGYAERPSGANVGYTIGTYLPAAFVTMMGLVVWLERRRAILFNMISSIFWGFLVLASLLAYGLPGLGMGFICLLFVPFWIGLFKRKYQWEVEAIRGSGN